MMLVNVPVPPNTMMMFQALFPIVTFDLIEVEWLYSYHLEEAEFNQPFTERFSLIGYETLYLFPNLSFLAVMYFFSLVLLIFTHFGKKIRC